MSFFDSSLRSAGSGITRRAVGQGAEDMGARVRREGKGREILVWLELWMAGKLFVAMACRWMAESRDGEGKGWEI
jgi:hypothetical protein